MKGFFNRNAPDLIYVGLVLSYVAAAYFSESALLVGVGFAAGWGTQMCLQWKFDRSRAAQQSKGEPT